HLYYSANDKKLKRFNLFVMMFFEILRIFKFTQKNACFLLSNLFLFAVSGGFFYCDLSGQTHGNPSEISLQ
ncbi:hypothetical protein, partial [Holdemania massiliensis]